jgi:signal transduction histidine kinase
MRGEVGVLRVGLRRDDRDRRRAAGGAPRQSPSSSRSARSPPSIAHEVRPPLSVLKTSAQLLGRSDLPSDEQRKLSGLLSGEVDRLNRVVTDLVDLARPGRPCHEPVSVRDAVERAVRFFAVTRGTTPGRARRRVSTGIRSRSRDRAIISIRSF